MAIIVINKDMVFYPIQDNRTYYMGNIDGVLDSKKIVHSRVHILEYLQYIGKELVEYDSVEDYLEKNQVSFAALEPEVTLTLRTIDKGPRKVWIENDRGERLTVNYYSPCTLYNSIEYKELKEKQQELFNHIKLK